MVELVRSDNCEIEYLEKLLIDANVEYQISIDIGKWGIEPPYLVVNGVPLDRLRALKWIKEYKMYE